MAIIKNIELNNGITLKYHRVVSVNNITNVSSVIEVAGYTTKTKRGEEKQAIENAQPMDVFIETEYINTPYDPDLNVVGAYDYLKTTEKYSGAKDDD